MDSCDYSRKPFEDLNSSLAVFEAWLREDNTQFCVDNEVDKLLTVTERNLSSCIAQIRSKVNSRASINRLPDDALKSIFEWLCPPQLAPYPCASRHNNYPMTPSPHTLLCHWIQLTTVCRRWMEIIISSPTLWSVIVIGPTPTPSKVFDTQLSFCGDALIDVYAWNDAPVSREMLRHSRFDWQNTDFRALVPRLRSLHLHAVDFDTDSDVYDQLDVPAPFLEHLTLYPNSWGKTAKTDYVLPTVFQDRIPHLTSLTIGFFTSWPGNRFRNLTNLCLAEYPVPMAPNDRIWSWTTSFFFAFLNESPLLETLFLENATPLIEDRPIFQQRRLAVHLPHLAKLAITGWPHSSSELLLSNLSVSPMCAVSIGEEDSLSGVDSELSSLAIAEGLSQSLEAVNSTLHDYFGNMTSLYLQTGQMFSSSFSILTSGKSGLHIKACPPRLYPWNMGALGQPLQMGALPPGGGLPLQAMQVPPPAAPVANPEYTQLPDSSSYIALYNAMNITELWIEAHHDMTASVDSWQKFYGIMHRVTKLVIIVRHLFGAPNLHCIQALRGDGSASPLPSLVELKVYHHERVSNNLLPILDQTITAREMGSPPDHGARVSIGVAPPLLLPDDMRQQITQRFGPEACLGTSEPIFNISPFDREIFLESRHRSETSSLPREGCKHTFCSCGVIVCPS